MGEKRDTGRKRICAVLPRDTECCNRRKWEREGERVWGRHGPSYFMGENEWEWWTCLSLSLCTASPSHSGSGLAHCVHSSVVVQRAAEGPAEPTTALRDRQKGTERAREKEEEVVVAGRQCGQCAEPLLFISGVSGGRQCHQKRIYPLNLKKVKEAEQRKEANKEKRREGEGWGGAPHGVWVCSNAARFRLSSILLFKLWFIACAPSFLFPRWKRGVEEYEAALLPCLSGAARKGDENSETLSKERQIHRECLIRSWLPLSFLRERAAWSLCSCPSTQKNPRPQKGNVSQDTGLSVHLCVTIWSPSFLLSLALCVWAVWCLYCLGLP